MSTKFYIKDDNGSILSVDGKTRYTLLEGKAAYDFLQTDNGRKRQFFVDVDENGDKLGVEVSHEKEDKVKEYEAEQRHARYLRDIEVECKITVVSANMLVSVAGEDDIEMLETFADQETDTEADALKELSLQALRSALGKLSPDEYDLVFHLFLSDTPMTERQYAMKTNKPYMTIHNRKVAILKKLEKLI